MNIKIFVIVLIALFLLDTTLLFFLFQQKICSLVVAIVGTVLVGYIQKNKQNFSPLKQNNA